MTAAPSPLATAFDTGLFGRLRRDAGAEWARYTRHPFVQALGAGTLPEACFRHYLVQDYLFLVQFARAYARAAYKSDTLAELREAAAGLTAILDTEMRLHVAYCAGWGIGEERLATTPEATATLAYTRFVLERGMAGDRLNLEVALAPCIVGYAEIALVLVGDPATRLDGNPYRSWIDLYAGADYQAVAAAKIAALDRLAEVRAGERRYPGLPGTFRAATRLEAGFWDMGLDPDVPLS